MTDPRMAESMSKEQIKHLVDRFLRWKLPENFRPDAGVSFKAAYNEHTAHPMKHAPVGTNLLDADQAEAMVRYMVESLPASPPDEAQDGMETTPAARWHEKGEPDPHGTRYDCERAKLIGGSVTDDEVANTVFMDPCLANLTVAKDRIRWLSRQLVSSSAEVVRLNAALAEANARIDAGLKTSDEIIEAEALAREAVAREQERERCAKIADLASAEHVENPQIPADNGWLVGKYSAARIAAAIRSQP